MGQVAGVVIGDADSQGLATSEATGKALFEEDLGDVSDGRIQGLLEPTPASCRVGDDGEPVGFECPRKATALLEEPVMRMKRAAAAAKGPSSQADPSQESGAGLVGANEQHLRSATR
jgi:hypothetical protein